MVKSRGLTFEYTFYNEESDTSEKLPALRGVDISIAPGEFVAVLGHNGSGKSTLAKHMNALLTPTNGTMWVKGLDTSEPDNVWNIRQGAGMVFQNPDNQIIATVVEEDVAFGPENIGVPSKEIRRRVDEALDTVRMSEYANHSPHFLSGGQKQRVAIAGVLAMKPDCIILDEPTAMLDPVGRNEVIDTVIKLNREENITVILITHFMEEAVKADRVVVMEEGSVVADGTPKQIFRQVERMKELGLDVPQMTELSYELNKLGMDIPDDILTIEEMVDALCQLI
jgi:energy-coupling factor transport system ATP-binding protein